MPPPKSKPRSATAGYTKTTRTDAKGRIIWKSKSGDDKVRCKSTSGANVGKMTWRKPVTKPAGAKGKAAPRKRKVGGAPQLVLDEDAFKQEPTKEVARALGVDVTPQEAEIGDLVTKTFTEGLEKINFKDSTSGQDFLFRLLGTLEVVDVDAKASTVAKAPARAPWQRGGGPLDDFEAGLHQPDMGTTMAQRVKNALRPVAAARSEIRNGNMKDEEALDLADAAWLQSEARLRKIPEFGKVFEINDLISSSEPVELDGTSGGGNGKEVAKKIFGFLFSVLLGLTAGSLFRLFFVWKDISISRFTDSKLNIAAFHYTQKFGMILGFLCRGAVCGIFVISSAVATTVLIGILFMLGSLALCALMFGKTTVTPGWVGARMKS